MSKDLEIIKKEHEKIEEFLGEMSSFLDGGKIDLLLIANLLRDLGNVWNSHELREERIFAEIMDNGGAFPEETMLIEQHKELKGHWTVLQDAVASGDKEKVQVALDTDGRMLIDKFRKHIEFEENYFDVLAEDGKF